MDAVAVLVRSIESFARQCVVSGGTKRCRWRGKGGARSTQGRVQDDLRLRRKRRLEG